jgi:tRNA(Ile)-lysidine synthase
MPLISAFERKVLQSLRAVPVPQHSRILVGFSGGPDSTALLYALSALGPTWPLTLIAAYLDHGLRPAEEIEAEMEQVSSAGRSLGVQTVVGRVPTGRIQENARRAGRSPEEAARTERHAFLRDTARKLECRFIALGHTADDQVETLIMRIFQGAGVAGLAGIPRLRGEIIRPILSCSRAEVLDYLGERRLSFRTDSTNLQPEFLRNAVRLNLAPAVEALFPGYRRGLFSLAEQVRLYNTFVENEAAERLSWEAVPGGYRIEGERFARAPGLLRVVSLYRLFDRLRTARVPANRDRPKRLPFRFLAPLLADEYVAAGRRTLLRGYGIRLFREGRFLVLLGADVPAFGRDEDAIAEAGVRDIVGDGKKGYLVVIESGGGYRIGGQRIRFHQLSISPAAGRRAGRGRKGSKGDIAPSQIVPPLVLRSRKPGDRISFQKGSKSIKKMYQEWRIPAEDRWKIPLLADRQGLVAVLGEPWGYPVRVRNGIDPALLAYLVEYDRVEEK